MQPEVCNAEVFLNWAWRFFLGPRLSAPYETDITLSPKMAVLTLREQNALSEHFQVNHNQFASLN